MPDHRLERDARPRNHPPATDNADRVDPSIQEEVSRVMQIARCFTAAQRRYERSDEWLRQKWRHEGIVLPQLPFMRQR